MTPLRRLANLLAGALATIGMAHNAYSGDDVEMRVDLELVLAVDISRSMDFGEQIIQRRGYIEAFRSREVISAITNGMWGRISVTYVEWSGSGAARVVVPWMLISDAKSAARFAAALEDREPLRISRTSISGALEFSQLLFGAAGWQGLRRVIDVSGDGPNNHGKPVKPVSAATANGGVTINGLPLMVRTSTYGFGIENLDEYYQDCVVGGPGAFVVPVYSWQEFPAAVRRKLVMEIAGREPEPLIRRIAAVDNEMGDRAGGTDCMIGEKLWNERMKDLEWR